MQPRVTAILVARRGGRALQQTLDALSRQTRRPDLLVIVDAAGDDEVTAALAAVAPTQFVTASSGLGFGELVSRGLGALPAPEPTASPYGGIDEWLWLLRHDTEPDDRALERLLAAVEIAPSVAAAGAKQMDAAHPTMIAGYGETLTRLGASIALAERELDQAQHDRTSDVMAMGEAALLVRRTVWNAVEGMDAALPSVDAALDLCVRIRLAGHRVIGVPGARVFVHESSALAARPGRAPRPVTGHTLARLRRAAQLHRRLAYAPAVAVPVHWLSLLPLALVRALGQLLRKRPTHAPGEFGAALAVAFSGAAVPSARRRIARRRTMGWAAIAPLRMPPDEVRRRRAIARDAVIAAQVDDRRPRPDFLPGGALSVALAALVGAVALAPLLGAPALLGGGLAPLAPDLESAWQGVVRTAEGAADPFAFVLALLGTLTFWQPSLSLVVLWIASLPIAALGAWWAAAAFARRPGPAAVIALLWALAPALLVALGEGRPAAVVVHLTLPWLVASAARAPRSWSATAVAGLTAAVVAASAPSLIPALIVTWAAWMLANPRRVGRLLTLPVPSIALFAPLVADQLRRGTPLGLLADPGLVVGAGAPSRTGMLLGWPDLGAALGPLGALLPATGDPLTPALPALVLAVLALPLPILAVIGLALPDGRRALIPLVVAVVGLTTAVLVSGISVTTTAGAAVPLDVGPALSLYWLGLLLAAGIGLDALRRLGAAPRAPGNVLGASVLAVTALAGMLAAAPAVIDLVTGDPIVRAGEPRTLPALVAAEAIGDPTIGTLVLSPFADGLAARIDRGAGPTLVDQRTVVATGVLSSTDAGGAADADAIAELVGNLAAPSGRDLTQALDELDVRFVLLAGADADSVGGAALAALDGNAALAPIGDTDSGRLWRVAAADDTRAAVEPNPAGSSLILTVQLGILGLTLLLAVPTSVRPRRTRFEGQGDDEPAPTFEAGDDDE